jgi:hypothetical protein
MVQFRVQAPLPDAINIGQEAAEVEAMITRIIEGRPHVECVTDPWRIIHGSQNHRTQEPPKETLGGRREESTSEKGGGMSATPPESVTPAVEVPGEEK